MQVSYRTLALNDIEALIHIENACFITDHLGRRSFRRLLQSPSAHVVGLCYLSTQELCAYGIMLTRVNSAWWRLYSLAVDPRYQGQGLARILLQHCLQQAQAASAEGMRLEVSVSNHSAQSLYYSCCFEVIDLLPQYYSNGEDGFRMQRSFNS